MRLTRRSGPSARVPLELVPLLPGRCTAPILRTTRCRGRTPLRKACLLQNHSQCRLQPNQPNLDFCRPCRARRTVMRRRTQQYQLLHLRQWKLRPQNQPSSQNLARYRWRCQQRRKVHQHQLGKRLSQLNNPHRVVSTVQRAIRAGMDLPASIIRYDLLFINILIPREVHVLVNYPSVQLSCLFV